MVICGFPGIGKSSISKTIPGVVDLESTPFNKDWEIYADVIEHMNKNGYTVLASSHIELRKELFNRGIKYIYVRPSKDLKEEYLERYKKRKNAKKFIDDINENWDNYRKSFKGEITFDLKSDQYLYDVLSTLTRSRLEEEISGGNFSSNFSSFIPEKPRKIISLIDKSAIESLKKSPKKLAEGIYLD